MKISVIIRYVIATAILGIYSARNNAGSVYWYRVTDLGTLGGNNSHGNAINALGHVTGFADIDNTDTHHAFLYDGEKLHDLGTLGGKNSAGTSINDVDQVAGGSDTPTAGQTHAFFHDGEMHDIGTLSGWRSDAFGINSKGHIVGYSEVYEFVGAIRNTYKHAFLYDETGMHDIGTLEGRASGSDSASYAYAINDADQITGTSNTHGELFGSSAFLYDSNGMRAIGGSTSLSSAGYAINNNGQVTGYYAFVIRNLAVLFESNSIHPLTSTDGWASSYGHAIDSFGNIVGAFDIDAAISSPFSSGKTHAFFYDGVDMRDLNNPILMDGNTGGWELTDATGINDVGQILANGTNSSGVTHALLLTPTKVTNLMVSLSVAPESVKVGETLNYVALIKNPQGDATDVQASIMVPEGMTIVSLGDGCTASSNTVSCPIGAFPEGSQATRTFVVMPQTTGHLSVRASISGRETDLTPYDNQAFADITVTAPIQPETEKRPVSSSSILLRSPNGGESFKTRREMSVTWTLDVVNPKRKLEISLSRDGGAKWKVLKSGVKNTGSTYLKIAKRYATPQARIRICVPKGKGMSVAQCDTSDENFVIEK